MSWLTLAFFNPEDEEAYQQEWARTYLPTMLGMIYHSVVIHAAMLLIMKLWDASRGLIMAQATYLAVLAVLVVACRAWLEQPRKWQVVFALAQFACSSADLFHPALDPAPPVGSPFGPLRFYSTIPIMGVVLGGGSAFASSFMSAAFTLFFLAAYAWGAFPWLVISFHEYVLITLYVFWAIAVGYIHEARIRQAWVLARRLRRAAAEAEAGVRAKSLFLSNCNHELRTPLHGIIGMTELLVETDLSSEQRDFLATVQRCTETLHAMVCDILDLEKASSGQLEIERRPFALRGPLEAATDVLYLQALGKGVDLACSLEAGLADARVVGDEMRLQQIVMNLASNAIKFSARQATDLDESDAEEGKSRLGNGQVSIRAERRRAAVCIAVRDNGIGIPADRTGDLFRPFSQLEAGHTRKYGGTGLGLALVKMFAEQMGGSVTVASAPGKGTTFTVLLPLPPVEDAASGESEEAAAGGAAEVRLQEWRASTREALEGALAAEGLTLRAGAPLLFTDSPEEAAAARRAARRRRVVELLPPGARAGSDSASCERLLLPVKLEALRAVLRARGRPSTPGVLAAERPGSGSSSPVPLRQLDTRVLIAEDNEVNARLLSRMLRRLGFPHDTVPDGEAAVEACRSGRYGLLITDIQMPRMSGWEACEAVRALQAAGTIEGPLLVVGCSANATAEDRERSLQAGMVEHLAKPCRLEQLRALLERIGLLVDDVGDPAAGEGGSGGVPTPGDAPPDPPAPSASPLP